MAEAAISPLRAQVIALARLEPDQRMGLLMLMTPADLLVFDAEFEAWRHDSQLPPAGEGWRTWLMQAGRGFGKTRAGAEWITRLATQRRRPVRIALVGATIEEARKVMVEGPDGLLAVGRRHGRHATPKWEPDLGRLTWPGGSVAETYSGASPEGLRGPQHHYAWCDELAKWAHAEETWAMLQMGLRIGERPRTLVTTTPKPIATLKKIAASPRTVVTRGRTDQNIILSSDVLEMLAETYGGTRLGRQELDGELIEEAEGALWTRALIDERRAPPAAGPSPGDGGGDLSPPWDADALQRVVIGVDPPASPAGTCGIIACGLGADGIGYVLGDHSVAGRSPEGWARAVAAAAETWGADRVVAETNQGGDMVESILRTIDCALPVRPVRARLGKGRRAEPVAALFEAGKARFVGAFAELEDQLCGMIAAGCYDGPGRSPDRADAMVWAMAELLLRKRREACLRAL